MDDTTTSPSWREGTVFKSLEALRPWLQWLVIVLMFLGGLYLYQRDTNAQQTVDLNELNRRQTSLEASVNSRITSLESTVEKVRSEMLSKEVFDAYHSQDVERQKRIEQMLMEGRR